MATSSFGPYHGLWSEDAPINKCIGIIPTPHTMGDDAYAWFGLIPSTSRVVRAIPDNVFMTFWSAHNIDDVGTETSILDCYMNPKITFKWYLYHSCLSTSGHCYCLCLFASTRCCFVLNVTFTQFLSVLVSLVLAHAVHRSFQFPQATEGECMFITNAAVFLMPSKLHLTQPVIHSEYLRCQYSLPWAHSSSLHHHSSGKQTEEAPFCWPQCSAIVPACLLF